MGTVIITTSGFSVYPAAAPAGWPANVAWPPTGSTVFNTAHTTPPITDADMLSLMAWVAASQFQGQGSVAAPISITTAQLYNAWVQTFFNGVKTAIQNYFTTPSVPPPPIGGLT